MDVTTILVKQLAKLVFSEPAWKCLHIVCIHNILIFQVVSNSADDSSGYVQQNLNFCGLNWPCSQVGNSSGGSDMLTLIDSSV